MLHYISMCSFFIPFVSFVANNQVFYFGKKYRPSVEYLGHLAAVRQNQEATSCEIYEK